MKSHARAPFAGSAAPITGSTAAAARRSRGLFGLVCLCVLGLAAFLGTGAPSAGAAESFPGQGFLPDNRAWEMVSPPDKNGGEIAGKTTSTRAAADGSAVSFLSFSGFGDVSGAGLSFEYVAQRTAEAGTNGWVTHSIQPSQEPQSAAFGFFFLQPYYYGEFSEDLTRGAVVGLSPLTDAPNVARTRNLYLRTDLRTPGQGTYELLTDSTTVLPDPGTGPNLNSYRPWIADASDDFGHVLFESQMNLTDDAPPQPAGCTNSINSCFPRLYEYDHGTVRLASVLPDGSAASSAGAGQGASRRTYTQGTISNDGKKIFFTSPVGVSGSVQADSQLYMRDGGANTVRLSASERIPANLIAEPRNTFWSATPDGDTVYFTSAEQLTDDDTNSSTDLYAYDTTLPASEPANLTRLSVDNEPFDGSAGEVMGVMGISDDGDSVYFSAQGQLVAGGSTSGSLNGFIDLYLWHQGELRNIGYLDSSSSSENTSMTIGVGTPSQVSSDGTRMAFVSADGSGLTGFDHGVCSPGAVNPGCRQIYVYDAEGNAGNGQLVCASCRPDGGPATADAIPRMNFGTGPSPATTHLNRYLSKDGSRVFFSTAERLVPQDVNSPCATDLSGVGDCVDVYQYNVAEDRATLLSSGASSFGSYFMDASTSGDDVFFVTRDRLSGWDVDGAYDLYTARVDGGLPEPQPAPPSCQGDGCQPAPRSLNDATPSSSSFLGSGNPATRKRMVKRCRKGERRVRRGGRTRCVGKRGKTRGRANSNRRASR